MTKIEKFDLWPLKSSIFAKSAFWLSLWIMSLKKIFDNFYELSNWFCSCLSQVLPKNPRELPTYAILSFLNNGSWFINHTTNLDVRPINRQLLISSTRFYYQFDQTMTKTYAKNSFLLQNWRHRDTTIFLTHFRWSNQLKSTTSRTGRFQKFRSAKKIFRKPVPSTVW